MDKFLIEGPTPLVGRVEASGSKNAALPALAATLLTQEPALLRRVPKVRDIRTMLRLLEHLGMGNVDVDGVVCLRRIHPHGFAFGGPSYLDKTNSAADR